MAIEYQIPITYVVSASAITPQQGLEPLKLSTIAIFTDEKPAKDITGNYIISRTASGVANTWGTNTETTQQAQIIYSQTPNILANNGYVIVAPFKNTAGTLTTADLSDNEQAILAVTDGDLTITVDGAEQTITGITFAAASDLAEAAEVLTAKISGVTVTTDENKFVFTSDTTGDASGITISATTAGSGTDLYGSSYLNGAAATAEAGENETLANAITRLSAELYFEGILTTRNVSDAEAQAAASLVQAFGNKIYAFPRSSVSALTGIFKTIKSYNKTKCLLYTKGEDADKAALNSRLFAAAYLSRGFAVNYNGSNTTITMNLKDLTGIEADTNISETILAQCEEVGCDCFPSIEGLAKVISNKQGGVYFDEVTNQIWLVSTIQRNVFNVLATTDSKIAQTDPALEIITKTIRNVCKQSIVNGMAAPGTWNSADTFGNYDDFYRNIAEFGYYIYHQPVSEQAQSEREARKTPLYQIAVKEAGAEHGANILIYIEP